MKTRCMSPSKWHSLHCCMASEVLEVSLDACVSLQTSICILIEIDTEHTTGHMCNMRSKSLRCTLDRITHQMPIIHCQHIVVTERAGGHLSDLPKLPGTPACWFSILYVAS